MQNFNPLHEPPMANPKRRKGINASDNISIILISFNAFAKTAKFIILSPYLKISFIFKNSFLIPLINNNPAIKLNPKYITTSCICVNLLSPFYLFSLLGSRVKH